MISRRRKEETRRWKKREERKKKEKREMGKECVVVEIKGKATPLGSF